MTFIKWIIISKAPGKIQEGQTKVTPWYCAAAAGIHQPTNAAHLIVIMRPQVRPIAALGTTFTASAALKNLNLKSKKCENHAISTR